MAQSMVDRGRMGKRVVRPEEIAERPWPCMMASYLRAMRTGSEDEEAGRFTPTLRRDCIVTSRQKPSARDSTVPKAKTSDRARESHARRLLISLALRLAEA